MTTNNTLHTAREILEGETISAENFICKYDINRELAWDYVEENPDVDIEEAMMHRHALVGVIEEAMGITSDDAWNEFDRVAARLYCDLDEVVDDVTKQIESQIASGNAPIVAFFAGCESDINRVVFEYAKYIALKSGCSFSELKASDLSNLVSFLSSDDGYNSYSYNTGLPY